MHRKKKEQIKQEAKKFSFVGTVSTVVDYSLLNLLTLVFSLPPIAANFFSTTVASCVSYRLNKKVVFNGRRHSRKRTILLYALVIGTGIYIIQNAMILLLYSPYASLAGITADAFGWHFAPDIIAINLAKATGGCLAGIWNYLMLRHFVFIPETKKNELQPAQ